MVLESKLFWIIVFYVLCGCAIGFVVYMQRLASRPKFRREDGEFVGVGYEEDPYGHVIGHPEPQTDVVPGADELQPPHMQV